jgi:cytochrome c-type biogenesis protein CcmH
MISFSIAAVLLCALAGALILQRAAAAARRPDTDPTLAVYRRQLAEIDDLAERGLLAQGELRAAKAEASRRLLNAAQSANMAAEAAPDASEAKPGVPRIVRLAVLAAAAIAPLLAVGLYLLLGKPGVADEPFADRLKAWTQSDPSQLDPQRMAAVLETVVKARPNEVEPLTYLARAQAMSGNLPAATETIRKATRLAPNRAELWGDLGQLLVMQSQGQETPAATAAFQKAAAIDPNDAAALYHLARAEVTNGQVAAGLNDWRLLLTKLPDGDEKTALAQEIDATAKAGHLVAMQQPQQQAQASEPDGAAPSPQAGAAAGAQDGGLPPEGSDQRKFIQTMVQRLADRLQQMPDDPAGWARLIRSYAILGDAPKMQAALDQAHKVFKDRPADLKTVDNAMAGGQ